MSALSSTGTNSALAGLSSTSSSSITGLNTSGIQFSGVISGLDTHKIIEGLLAIEQAQIDRLTNNKKLIADDQAAFKTLQAKLIDLQDKATGLARTFNGLFDARTATSSNPTLVTASAASGSAPGTYSFQAQTLAYAEQRASQGLAASSSVVAQGTLEVRVGSGAVSTITIDGTNNTLEGVASAINELDGDVTASIVNDGTVGQPFHLLLTSNKSGAANTITLTSTPAPGSTDPVLDLSTVVQPASDASIKLGSGPGALTLTSSTNQFLGAFNGVTLNLLGADPTQTVSVTVAGDTAPAKEAIEDFVTAYNAVIDYVTDGSTYDPQTGTAGIFLGNSNASNIQSAVVNAVTRVVAGLSSQVNNLAALGILSDAHGDLVINDAKLTQALDGQLSGVTSDSLRRLFAVDANSTNPGVHFIFASNKTKEGAAVQVEVTQAATHGALTGTAALVGSFDLDGNNNTLNVTVDGQAAALVLAQGHYATPQALVQELQNQLSASPALVRAKAVVGLDSNGNITITSQTYGSTSGVAVTGGTAVGVLGLTGSQAGQGLDVVGHFLVNGAIEAAQGKGQLLTGSSGNANTADLTLRVALSASQLTPGPVATVTVTRGVASRLGQVLSSILDPIDGRLKGIDKSFNDTSQAIQEQIDRQTAAIQARQQSLVLRFAAMEAAIAQLQTAGNFLNGLLPFNSDSSSSSSS